MKRIRIIPRLDIKGPNLVKGVQLEGIRVLGRPEEFSSFYYQNGADELVYMDVVASLYGRNSLVDIIEKTAQSIFIPLTVGGGLRTIEDMAVVLRAGADKVALNTGAVRRPELINEAANRFGSSTIVISIEAKHKSGGSYEVYVDNGREQTGREVVEWAQEVFERGAGEILLTSIDREGTGKGFDLELVKTIAGRLPIPVIACGGCGNIGHAVEVIKEAGADAVCMASIFHYGYLARQLGIEAISSQPGKLGVQKPSTIQSITIDNFKAQLQENGILCRREWELAG